MKVIISNSSINSYGGRVLTTGIDLTQYQKNPILLYMHMRADEINYLGGKNPVLGIVENISVEGDNLVGELKFSDSNPFAQEIKKLYDEGTLRMVSPGFRCVEWSDDSSVLLPGQTNSTLTKCKLREVSCCDIGSNDDALRLYDENDKVIELKGGGTNLFPVLKDDKKANKNDLIMNKNVLDILNLTEGTDEKVVVSKIKELQLRSAKADELEKAIKEQSEKAIFALVDDAVVAKKITADKKEVFLTIGKNAGIDALKASLEAIVPAVNVANSLNNSNGGGKSSIELTAENWDKMDKAGSLRDLKLSDNESFKALFKAKFGVEYNKD